MKPLNWTCPHCCRSVTITSDRASSGSHVLSVDNDAGPHSLVTRYFVCPNPECQKFTLTADLFKVQRNPGVGWEQISDAIHHWDLVPDSQAKPFPLYIPAPILEDYREACLIRTLSPKASATLSRRALQGIVRDFWKVKPGRLVDEIKEIEALVDPATWGAIDAVRKIGNVGAHMEKDISVIVEVDPNEANLLIQLIETLLHEWYVVREERARRMSLVIATASSKKGGAVVAAPSYGVPGKSETA